MATNRVIFLHIRDVSENERHLEPAPSMSEWKEIAKGLEGVPSVESIDHLKEQYFHEIRGNYRNNQMWLYPNVHINRYDHKTPTGNGYGGMPWRYLREEVELRVNNKLYGAYVEFV